jgi:AMMECR1 domain-containing protein
MHAKKSIFQEVTTMKGWLKIKSAARYAGVSERKFRDLVKDGLRHVRLPTGTILTQPDWIDEYYQQFEADPGRLDAIVDDVLADIGPRVRTR